MNKDKVITLVNNLVEIGREIGANEALKEEHPELSELLNSVIGNLKTVGNNYLEQLLQFIREDE